MYGHLDETGNAILQCRLRSSAIASRYGNPEFLLRPIRVMRTFGFLIDFHSYFLLSSSDRFDLTNNRYWANKLVTSEIFQIMYKYLHGESWEIDPRAKNAGEG